MWISAMFDLPVLTACDRKNYREVRNMLISSGFVNVQKSLFWRWVENKEFAEALIHRVQKKLPCSGDIIFLYIPDTAFKESIHIVNGAKQKTPDPPPPWLILT